MDPIIIKLPHFRFCRESTLDIGEGEGEVRPYILDAKP